MTKNEKSPVPFYNFNEKEPTTVIKSITFLKPSSLLVRFIAYIFVLLTGFIFGIFLFWSPKLRSRIFYYKVRSIEQATHVLVEG